MTKQLYSLAALLFLCCIICINSNAIAGNRFKTNYPCSDQGKYCVSSGTKKIDGFDVSRPCWEYSYTKKCNYPSKNDCAQHTRCYSLGQRDCILHDSLGNCVNIKKEFSCKRWSMVSLKSDTVRYDTQDKDGAEKLVCENIPCVDGNCMDKSYQMDEDMLSSISQLGALSQGKNTQDVFKIFEGLGHNCTKKPANYQNCCHVKPKGWGKQLGAKCSKDEEILGEKRQKNLCVYVGKEFKKIEGVTILTKLHYCCFNNMLEKVVQVEGRKQLGMNFGNASHVNCRGLTLKELSLIDFSKMDFSKVAAEMQQKLAMPNVADVKGRINSSFKNSNKFDKEHEANPKNRLAGTNKGYKEGE